MSATSFQQFCSNIRLGQWSPKQ